MKGSELTLLGKYAILVFFCVCVQNRMLGEQCSGWVLLFEESDSFKFETKLILYMYIYYLSSYYVPLFSAHELLFWIL